MPILRRYLIVIWFSSMYELYGTSFRAIFYHSAGLYASENGKCPKRAMPKWRGRQPIRVFPYLTYLIETKLKREC